MYAPPLPVWTPPSYQCDFHVTLYSFIFSSYSASNIETNSSLASSFSCRSFFISFTTVWWDLPRVLVLWRYAAHEIVQCDQWAVRRIAINSSITLALDSRSVNESIVWAASSHVHWYLNTLTRVVCLLSKLNPSMRVSLTFVSLITGQWWMKKQYNNSFKPQDFSFIPFPSYV